MYLLIISAVTVIIVSLIINFVASQLKIISRVASIV